MVSCSRPRLVQSSRAIAFYDCVFSLKSQPAPLFAQVRYYARPDTPTQLASAPPAVRRVCRAQAEIFVIKPSPSIELLTPAHAEQAREDRSVGKNGFEIVGDLLDDGPRHASVAGMA